MSELDHFEGRIIRGHILKILKLAFPGPAGKDLLEYALGDRKCGASPAEINSHIEYLREKEYVTITHEGKDITGMEHEMVRISAKGIDLIEGNIPPDPGVRL